MKKLLWTVAALAALSFAVVGCNQNTDDETKQETPADETPAEVTEKVIFETAQTKSGNVDYSITEANFTEYLKDYTKIIFTLKNGGTEDRNGWGVLCLISQETSGDWTWHNLKSNTTLGTDQYGQLSSASFAAGAETTMELSLQDLADAVKAEGETNRLALQTSNGALLLKITLK